MGGQESDDDLDDDALLAELDGHDEEVKEKQPAISQPIQTMQVA